MKLPILYYEIEPFMTLQPPEKLDKQKSLYPIETEVHITGRYSFGLLNVPAGGFLTLTDLKYCWNVEADVKAVNKCTSIVSYECVFAWCILFTDSVHNYLFSPAKALIT